MDGRPAGSHYAPVRVLPHIKKLDDALGDFIVRVTCPCGTSRHIEPEALARIAGRSVTVARLSTRMRCSRCGKKVAEVVAVARPRPRSVPKFRTGEYSTRVASVLDRCVRQCAG